MLKSLKNVQNPKGMTLIRHKTFIVVIKVLKIDLCRDVLTEWCSGQRVGLITQRSEVRILVQSFI